MQGELSCTLIENIHNKVRRDLKLYKPHKIESVFVEVIMPKRTNIIVGCISRHPDNNIEDFNTSYLRPLLHFFTWEL